MKHYLSNCWLWLRGFAWLWTREAELVSVIGTRGRVSVMVWENFSSLAHLLDKRRGDDPHDLNSISYKPGWGPGRFALVYLLNIGTHVILSGGAVTTWSRAAWDLRQSGNRWGRLLDRAIQALLGDDHGKQSGAVLWGSTPCAPKMRWAVAIGWTVFFVWVFA